MKKIIAAVLITASIFCAALGFTACGNENQQEEKNLEYTLSTDESYYTVSGKGTYTTEKEIIIPETYEGKPVKAIGEKAFQNNLYVEKLTVSDSVTAIEDYAFWGCSNLVNLSIPDGISSLGKSVFYSCEKLQLNKYDNAKYLGNKTNPFVILVKAESTEISACIINENTKVIADQSFMSCVNLAGISLPEGVKIIGEFAFSGCFMMKSLTLPSTLTEIRDYAFQSCSGLKTITFDGTVEQWNKVVKANGWDSNMNEYTVKCTAEN